MKATPESEPAQRADDDAEQAVENESASADDSAAATHDSSAPSTEGEESELERVIAERDKFKEQLLRTAAELENSRKRARRETEEAKTRAKDDVLRDLLPVFDNLERAVAAGENAQDVASVVEGVRMVLKLFKDTAERIGLARVESVGQRFDPNVHEAIQQQETDEYPPGTVMSEVMPGYMFGERLIRAAMVVVARPPQPKSNPDGGDEGDSAEETDVKGEGLGT